MRSLLRVFSLLFLCVTQAYAWDATGHMLVAAIAYTELRPSVQEKVDALITSMGAEYPDSADFVTASVWADDIKGDDVTLFNRWHYIDILDYPPPVQSSPLPPSPHVAWAISQNTLTLKSVRANHFEKALALRFICHLVGDIHQPLHTISHVSANHPQGDLGGTLFGLQGHGGNLHNLWDNGVDHFKLYDRPLTKEDRAEILQLADDIAHRYPLSHFAMLTSDMDPGHWARESFGLARSAYEDITENSSPSASYIARNQAVAEREIALAGYRLAFLLNSALG